MNTPSSPSNAGTTPNPPAPFGAASDGTTVEQVTLRNAQGWTCTLLTHGARVRSLHVPDRDGRLGNVVLGFDHLAVYEGDGSSFGATCGRVAGRIAKGKYTLDGTPRELDAHDSQGNHRHGGKVGFMLRHWDVEDATEDRCTLALVSEDGDQRYPGRLVTRVTYTLEDDALRIDYRAETDAPTPVNLTNHSYFNLGGVPDGASADQLRTQTFETLVRLDCDEYLECVDMIPTGERTAVQGTPLDFRTPRTIGERIADLTEGPRPGYDHALQVRGHDGALRETARCAHPPTGRSMTVLSDQPCLVFYSTNLKPEAPPFQGSGGAQFGPRSAFCIEMQKQPDAINRQDDPHFADVIVRPGTPYTQTTIYRFAVE
ncbi:MAG: aldose epimerase family protein [Planctomycetota bacterium]